MHIVEAEQEFSERFRSGDWASVGGNIQSAAFATQALFSLQQHAEHLLAYIAYGKRLVDYGCAMGDGTAAIATIFPTMEIIGCDISQDAVRLAAARWPTLRFQCDDIQAPTLDAHCIWTSHTLEHLVNPAATLKRLQKQCRILVAIFPPIEDEQKVGPHMGAPLTKDWLNEMESPLFHTKFETYRRDHSRSHNGKQCLLLETSLLCVWRGTNPL